MRLATLFATSTDFDRDMRYRVVSYWVDLEKKQGSKGGRGDIGCDVQ